MIGPPAGTEARRGLPAPENPLVVLPGAAAAVLTGGVTLHWHGYRVPAGEDGVAGLTQDAVPPRGEFVYRFRATDVGTYWYHSHQASGEAVRRGHRERD